MNMVLQLPSTKACILNLCLLFVLTKVHRIIVECCPMGILDYFLSIEEGAIQVGFEPCPSASTVRYSIPPAVMQVKCRDDVSDRK